MVLFDGRIVARDGACCRTRRRSPEAIGEMR